MATKNQPKQRSIDANNPEFTDISSAGDNEPISETTTIEPTSNNENTTTDGYTEPTEPTIKKPRGRPKGSTNKKADTIGIEEETVKSYKKTVRKDKSSHYTEQEANEISEYILAAVQGVGYSFVGEPALLNSTEKLLFGMSLPAYLQTVNLETINKSKNVIFPLAGILGATMYSIRVIKAYREQQHLKKEEETRQAYTENNTFNPEPIDIPEHNTYTERDENKWMSSKPYQNRINNPI